MVENGRRVKSAKSYFLPFREAVGHFTDAIARNPTSARNFAVRGGAWKKQKAYERAVADYDEAIRLRPNVAAWYNNRGVIRVEAEQSDTGIADDAVLAINPTYGLPSRNRGAARLKEGTPQEPSGITRGPGKLTRTRRKPSTSPGGSRRLARTRWFATARRRWRSRIGPSR